MARRRWILALPALLFLVTIALGGVFLRDVVASSGNIYSELALFNEVLTLISEYYVEPLPPDSLIEGAVIGMLERLDPHSNYMNAERFQRMEERNRGSYSGIGISFAIRDGNLTVISPIEGSPSYDLGIRPGDVITHIEGESAFGINEQEVFDRLRGPKGSHVRITIRRAGEPEPLEYEIVRDNIPIQSVPYAFMLTPTTGYVMMRNFSARTADELKTALQGLSDLGMTELILDLRGNSGGYLNAAVDVADIFLSGGKKLVYTLGRIPGSSEEYHATSSDRADYPDLPLVILIDQGSASASEIVSGAVQDWDRGLVAGRTSFGKALVQRQYRLRNQGALLLTVARYYTPSGRLIQRPYNDETRQEYYMEAGGEDSFSGAAEEAVPDTSGRPLFRTLVQDRTVYGGGGIMPDVRIDRRYLASRLYQRLVYDRKFFDFAKELIDGGQAAWGGNFRNFLDEFEVADEWMERFRTYLTEGDYRFEPDSLAAHPVEMKRGLQSEIARYLWGESERYQVLVRDDPALGQARELLPQARAMLEETRRREQLQARGKAQK